MSPSQAATLLPPSTPRLRSWLRGTLGPIMTWLMFALFLLTLALWGDSYVLCRQYLWGDRHRGNYVFVTSSYGNLFLERRSNCDVSHHFTRNHQRAYGYGAWRPTTSRDFLGFGSYSGTRYCW